MAIQFTDNQTRVLNARRHNVLVSAAAGSGKTAVLVERIIRMISEDEHPLDIDRLLVVTFTRAAAAQMRERIAKAIAKRLAEHPDDRHLQRQETLLHRAQIMTIDSFCMFLLRNNFSEIDLDPGFRQIDETEAKLIEGDCLRKYLEECYASALHKREEDVPEDDLVSGRGDAQWAERFQACAEYFCPGGSDAALEELILKLYKAACSHPYPEAWLEERKKDYRVSDVQELMESAWYRQLMEERIQELREIGRQYEVLLKVCREPDGPYVYLPMVEAEGAALFGESTPQGPAEKEVDIAASVTGISVPESAGSTCAPQDPEVGMMGAGDGTSAEAAGMRRQILRAAHFSFGRLPAVRRKEDKAAIDPAKQERAKTIRNGIRERMKELAKGIDEEPELTVQRMQEMAGPIETLIDLTLGFMNACAKEKRDKNVIDFNDLEHMALQILIDRAPDGTLTLRRAAQSYRDYYDEVIIDEYQDSNEVQELLLCAVAGEREAGFAMDEKENRYARFMVGDVKQSIYRFRNARPGIFQRKFDTYETEGGQRERIDLDQNFRSRREVLDAANGVCRRIMRREIGGVEYCDEVSLKPGASYPDPVPDRDGSDPYQTELLLIDDTPPKAQEEAASSGTAPAEEAAGEPEDEIAAMSAARKEALVVAQKIRSIVGVLPIYDRDRGSSRPARYRDIVILLRSSSGRQDAYREIFEKEGIPLYLEYKEGYFETEEVRAVLQLLRVIDNPRQDIPLYGVLRGYYGGFTQDEIAQIRVLGREVQKARQQAEADSAKRAEAAGAAAVGGAGPSDCNTAGDGDDGSDVAADAPDPADPEPAGTPSRSGIRGGGLYESLLTAAAWNEDDGLKESAGAAFDAALSDRCAAFLDWLNALRVRSQRETIRELLGHLIRDTGYEDYVRALPAGQRRAANVHTLLVKAEGFEASDHAGLFRFLRYIDQMHSFDVDYGEAAVIDEQADVVRLTTIHKSKGLEYPVCFVSGLGSPHPFRQDLRGSVVVDEDLGLGADYVDTRLRCSTPTLRRMALEDKITRDALGEELRVLYVAMTRAEEKLILTGYTKNIGKLLEKVDLALTSADCASDAAAGRRHAPRDEFTQVNSSMGSRLAASAAMSETDDPISVGPSHLPVSAIRGASGYLQLVLESIEAMKAQGQEPIRVSRIPVSELHLAEAEDQMTLAELQRALLAAEQTSVEQLPSPETAARLEESFSRVYPYGNLTGLYTKTTVTELKRAAMVDDGRMEDAGEPPAEMYPAPGPGDLPVPRFAETIPEEAKPLIGAFRGTAVHRMCELIDYREWRDPGAVTEEMFRRKVDALLGAGGIPPSYAPAAVARTFLPFLHSGIAARMAAADAKGLLKREQPFVLGIAANRLNPDFPGEETILIQGIIDAFFIEEDGDAAQARPDGADSSETAAQATALLRHDGACAASAAQAGATDQEKDNREERYCAGKGRHIVLVDYKTDRVKTGQELIDRYRVQMNYYAEALESMLGLPVTEKILYSFHLQEEILLD